MGQISHVLQNMQDQVRQQEEKAFKYQYNRLNLLIETTDLMQDFFMGYAWDIEPHLSTVTRGKYLLRSKLPQKAQRALELANLENTLVDIFPDLWEELGEVIRNLVASNYRSVYRSLRWLIESAMFWMDIELDKKFNNAIDHFDNYYISMPKPHSYSFNQEYIIHYNSDLLEERLRLKEKYERPSIGESAKRLEDFKISRKSNPQIKSNEDRITLINSAITKMGKQQKELYHEFSAFSHITIETLRRDWKSPQYYPYSMDYGYNKAKFRSALENLWKVIDLVASIMLLVCSRFYGYQMPYKYLEAIITNKHRKHNATSKLVSLAKSGKGRNDIPIFSALVK